MKISDLLRTIADNIDTEADKDINLDDANHDDDETAEELTDAMVPPLQQELEIKKKTAGMRNSFDYGQVGESTDELAIIKKLTGLQN